MNIGGILLTQNEQTNTICSNTDGTRDYHNKSERKTNTIYHLYVKSKKMV